MQVQPVDPRDSRWELDAPAYRVYFWQAGPAGGWVSDEWRLSDADIVEVQAWAHARAAGRYVTLWVEVVAGDDVGLVRLSGWEPTRADAPPPWVTPAG